MEHHQKLCNHFQAYYVPGLGGISQASSAETIRILRETVFGLEFEESCIKFHPNLTTNIDWLSGNHDKKATEKIANLATQHTKNRCGKVSFILFGHSNGGEIAVRVFEHLKDILPANEFKRVKRCSAVFTLGSPKWIRHDLAEITLNALLRNDEIAEAGAAMIDQNGADQGENFLYIGPVERHKCQCCSNRSTAKESRRDEIGLSQQLMCSSKALSTWSFSSLPSFSSNSGVGHFCNEYMSCRKLRLKIKDKLQITGGDIKCRCGD